jgi:hypothetical protein
VERVFSGWIALGSFVLVLPGDYYYYYYYYYYGEEVYSS